MPYIVPVYKIPAMRTPPIISVPPEIVAPNPVDAIKHAASVDTPSPGGWRLRNTQRIGDNLVYNWTHPVQGHAWTFNGRPPDWVPVGMNPDGTFIQTKDRSKKPPGGSSPPNIGGGGSPPAGGGGGAPPSAPPISDPGDTTDAGDFRVQILKQQIAAQDPAVVDAYGNLTSQAQRDLVDGLGINAFTDELISYLSQSSFISFDVDQYGRYVNGSLVTAADKAAQGTVQGVDYFNFPTAYHLALAGHPIARAGWALAADAEPGTEPSGLPSKWVITYDGSAWFVVDSAGRLLVTSEDDEEPITANITAVDLLNRDWMLPPDCNATITHRPDFPTDAAASTPPRFNVFDPPCLV